MISEFPLDFSRLRKTWRPNQCLALPPGFAGHETPDIESPVFDASVDDVARAWRALALAEPRVASLREAGGQMECVQRTPVLRFPDHVTAQAVDLGDGRASICVYSRARFGVRDFGVNRRRVEAWLGALGGRLTAHG